MILGTTSGEWDVDPTRINRLKEEYKRERHIKQAHQSTTITNSTSASIRNSLFNNGGDDLNSDQQDEQSNTQKYSINRFNLLFLVYSMMFKNSKNFIGDNTIEGLDELARETVSNDNEFQDDVRFNSYHRIIDPLFRFD